MEGNSPEFDGNPPDIQRSKPVKRIGYVATSQKAIAFKNRVENKRLREETKIKDEKIEVLQNEVQDISRIDMKTGLPNAQAVQEDVEREIELIRRNPKRTLRFMLLDIDKFGSFNNNYGLGTGDETLKKVANVIPTRKTDIHGRWGGEEFIAAFPSEPGAKTTSDLTHPAERIRKRIEDIPFDTDENIYTHPNSSNVLPEKVTASIGTVVYEQGETFDDMLLRASLANTIAKLLGRNRTVESVIDPEGHRIFNDLSTDKSYSCEFNNENRLIRLHNVETPEVLDVETDTNGKLRLAV